MVRLLRRLLRLGLLAGVAVGALKAVKGRKAPDPWAESWVSTGPPGGTRPSAAPITPAAPKPPAPPSTATASVAAPPPAGPKPPAPASPGPGSRPPAATPAPPPPETATGGADKRSGAGSNSESNLGDADSKEADRAAGDPKPSETSGGKAAAGRATKSTRKGPARKSPTGKAEEPPGERLWVPANDGVCPQSHPVKAKLSSKIFHTQSSRNYGRTKADRCYPDEASAQADGLRPAQR